MIRCHIPGCTDLFITQNDENPLDVVAFKLRDHLKERHGLDATVRIDDIEIREYWCPTQLKWGSCPGPCSNGTVHTEMRIHPTKGFVIDVN